MTTPDWPTCTHASGCAAIQRAPHTFCLAHLGDADLAAVIEEMTPGDDLDGRGVTFAHELLRAILAALTSPDTGGAIFGEARFDQARFADDTVLDRAQFTGDASFDGARFAGDASFVTAQFTSDASFSRAQFTGNVSFTSAAFAGDAAFFDAQFDGETEFDYARFAGRALFDGAQFAGRTSIGLVHVVGAAQFSGVKFADTVLFEGAQFADDVTFTEARFEARVLGPLVCGGEVNAMGMTVCQPLRLRITARQVDLGGARFES